MFFRKSTPIFLHFELVPPEVAIRKELQFSNSFIKNYPRIKLLEEEHARHQIICNPELHSGLYGRKLTRRAQPRRTATKRRKISSNQNKEFEEKPEPIKPLPSHEKYIPPIQVFFLVFEHCTSTIVLPQLVLQIFF